MSEVPLQNPTRCTKELSSNENLSGRNQLYVVHIWSRYPPESGGKLRNPPSGTRRKAGGQVLPLFLGMLTSRVSSFGCRGQGCELTDAKVLGFGVWGLNFGVQGLRFRVKGY